MTVSTENFVKTVYYQESLTGSNTKLSTLAGLLNITNAAATDMARKLSEKKLVNYTKYKPLRLTEIGIDLALNVIRKHRLWEAFLFKTLNLSLHEIHREAENLEHLTSDFLAERIDSYLGHPSTDPHGDPIPALNGTMESDKSQVLLSLAMPGKFYEICRLFSSDKDFFDFCNSSHINIGTFIRVEKQLFSGKMTEIRINQDKIILNEEFSSIIYVKQKDQEK
jgi:DtxR family Mn-dependent transcriptional regulator